MPIELIALSAPVVLVAYTVFGMTGFGSAVIAVPILVQAMPLQSAVPLVVLFDLVCTAIVGGSNWRQVSSRDLLRILPWLLLGIAAGTMLLHNVEAKWPLIALGVFVLFVCARNLIGAHAVAKPPFAGYWVGPFGMVGGVFSALFGTGGPIYTIYLSRRLTEVDQFRATMSVLILFSGISRAVAFGMAGLYTRAPILQMAATLLPISLLGVLVGSRLRSQVPAAILKHLINLLLAIAGASALYRGIISPA